MKTTYKARAFTLIEMALLLIVFGVIISTALPKMFSEIKTEKARKSKGSVIQARDELIGYAIVHGQLPEPDTTGADPVVPGDIRARADTWDEGIVFILPNTNSTGGRLYEDDICGIGVTDMSVATPAETTDEVAFIVASKGMNLQRDIQYSADNPGNPRTVTAQAYGAASAIDPTREYDDVAEFVTLDYLKSKMDCTSYSPAPPGSPTSDLGFNDTNDNLQFNGNADTVDPETAGGGIGDVLELDGTGDYVQLTNTDDYAMDTYTIMGWFKTTDSASAVFQPIIVRQLSQAAYTRRTFWIGIWSTDYQNHQGGEMVLKAGQNVVSSDQYNVDSDAEGSGYPSTVYHRDGEWHFFAATMEDLGETTDVDGTPDADPTDNSHRALMYASYDIADDLRITPVTWVDATKPRGPDATLGYVTYIGQEYAGGPAFEGYIDELVIYDHALTETEIGNWYNSTKPYYN